MSAELIAFLHARLDEDAAVARAASDGPWRSAAGPEKTWQSHRDLIHPVATWDRMVGAPVIMTAMQADADHIARHDPARVLADIEAKRRIIRAHGKWCDGRCEAPYPEGGFDAAHYWSIKSLAAAYAGHPDYREEFRP